MCCFIRTKYNTCHIKQANGCLRSIALRIFVVIVNHFSNSTLNDCLCTFVAREQRDIQAATAQICNIVQNGIQFCMADKWILGFQECAFPFPWHRIISTTSWHSIVSNRYNSIFRIHNAGTDLRMVILAALCRKQCHTHKVFIPTQIIHSFHCRSPDYSGNAFPVRK